MFARICMIVLQPRVLCVSDSFPTKEKSLPHLHGLRQLTVWQLHQLFGSARVNGLALGLGEARNYGRHHEKPFKSCFKEGILGVLRAGQTASSSELPSVQSHLARGHTPSQAGQYPVSKGWSIKACSSCPNLGELWRAILAPRLPMDLAKAGTA